ncbi:hypothetical protein K438DRAFT_691216 [Mycena galopus ATCC 62051]|nr:hypothetical protein K438DRAFT_691216 [Mycena galopus ATCC 62051]
MELFPLASPPCVVGARPSDLVILSVGRQKNPGLLLRPPLHLTLCGRGRASHAPHICRRRPLPRLSASALRRARRSRHIHPPAHGQEANRGVYEWRCHKVRGFVLYPFCTRLVCTVTPRVDAVASALPVFVAETKFHESARGIRGGACARWGACDGPAGRPDELHMHSFFHSRCSFRISFPNPWRGLYHALRSMHLILSPYDIQSGWVRHTGRDCMGRCYALCAARAFPISFRRRSCIRASVRCRSLP